MAARQQRGRPGQRRGRLDEQPATRQLGLRGRDGFLGNLDDAPAARAHGGEDLGAAGRPRDRDALRDRRAGLDLHGFGRVGRPRPGERRAAFALHADQHRRVVDQARGVELAKAAGGPEQERAVADGEDQRLGARVELLPQLERVRLGALEEVRVVDVRGVHRAGGADGVDRRLGRGGAVAGHELQRGAIRAYLALLAGGGALGHEHRARESRARRVRRDRAARVAAGVGDERARTALHGRRNQHDSAPVLERQRREQVIELDRHAGQLCAGVDQGRQALAERQRGPDVRGHRDAVAVAPQPRIAGGRRGQVTHRVGSDVGELERPAARAPPLRRLRRASTDRARELIHGPHCTTMREWPLGGSGSEWWDAG